LRSAASWSSLFSNLWVNFVAASRISWSHSEAQISKGIDENQTHVAPTSMYLEVPPFCIGDNNLQLHVE
jgi:hypothetical protein